ncbi:MAG: FmdB family transcriptional regulator [Solirubrobacterales bacterium]|jgi:putative FmdB family regulatory protein|nr:FmdB family transcriptional regulator [Solirubrobacterales bacterium]
MPIYEYRRPDGTTFELVQRMSEDSLTTDPETGAPVQRVFHSPALHFKGKGFYNTDYGTKNRQREMEKSAKEGADKTDAKKGEKNGAKGGDGGSSSSSTSSDSSSSGSSSTSGSSEKSGSTSTPAKKAS